MQPISSNCVGKGHAKHQPRLQALDALSESLVHTGHKMKGNDMRNHTRLITLWVVTSSYLSDHQVFAIQLVQPGVELQ